MRCVEMTDGLRAVRYDRAKWLVTGAATARCSRNKNGRFRFDLLQCNNADVYSAMAFQEKPNYR